MDVNHHSLVVLDAGAEVLPDHNVPVSTELNQEVFRFENPDPARPDQAWPGSPSHSACPVFAGLPALVSSL